MEMIQAKCYQRQILKFNNHETKSNCNHIIEYITHFSIHIINTLPLYMHKSNNIHRK